MEELKEKIEEIVGKLKNDNGLLDKFKNDPIATLKDLVDDVIPEEKLDDVVKFIKAKFDDDDENGGIVDKIKGIFDKK